MTIKHKQRKDEKVKREKLLQKQREKCLKVIKCYRKLRTSQQQKPDQIKKRNFIIETENEKGEAKFTNEK